MNSSTVPNSSKILIIGPSWVGDMVMAQSLFMAIKQQDPAVQIDVMAPAWSNALLERMPEVTDVIDMPLGHGQLQLKLRYQLGKSLRQKHYSQAILLPNSLKSALVPFWASIPKRTGYVGEFRYGLLNDLHHLDKSKLTMTVQRFVALANNVTEKDLEIDKIPVPSLQVKKENVQTVLDEFKLLTDKPVLALCPGAEYGPAKQWPARHYASLAKEKMAQGWQVWLFGSQKDHEIAEQINRIIEQESEHTAVNLCGKTQLAQAIDLMSLSNAVVSNDSGLMHMGAALGVPVVGVYGSSDPKFTPPLGDNSAMQSLNLDCSPCFKRICPLGHTNCLEKLSPKMVLEALNNIAADLDVLETDDAAMMKSDRSSV
ncbi:MAG: lipopolysaccharide heptosyltransferase II [Gammaproteobacteria bacterium]|nr:lipopolysaccharide heptosyltransferase II [Gammaproteobacteria bacterium]